MSRIFSKIRFVAVVAAMIASGQLFSSCNKILQQNQILQQSQILHQAEGANNLLINDIDFSEDFKTIKVTATAVGEYGENIQLDSAGTCVTASQHKLSLFDNGKDGDLKVSGLRNLTEERFDSLGLRVVILVDLTLSQEQIDAERLAVAQIRYSFNPDNLFISFLKSEGVITPTEPLTDFVIENNFFEDSGIGDKYLYNGILDKVAEMDTVAGDAKTGVLVVMSDGYVWGEDGPLDPQHFNRQDELGDYADKIDVKGRFFYSNFSIQDPADILGTEKNKTIIALCEKLGGVYQDEFDWEKCCRELETHFHLRTEDFEMTLTVPDGYYYEGIPRRLTVKLQDAEKDEESLVGTYDFTAGNAFFPTIINGLPGKVTAFRGIFLLAIILFLAFIVLQLVIPAIKYKLFLKHDVAQYTGPTMCINGRMVADTCYLCKAPFKDGETIVGKCEHTMHKECWDENDHHCPEYGSRCKDGSHYYNSDKLLDWRNAPYYTKWIIVAIIASIISWVCFYFFSNTLVIFTAKNFIERTFHLEPLSAEFEQMYSHFNSYTSYLPALSTCISVPLVGLLSFFVVRSNVWWKRLLNVLLRTLCAAVFGVALFQLNSVFALTISNNIFAYIFEFVIWVLFTLGVALCLTIKTSASVYPRKFFYLLAATVVLSFLGSFLIMYCTFDYRPYLALYFLLYCCFIALAVAFVAPRSYRYMLRTTGCIKTTDIALYKWFRANPAAVVTIGRSVDCSIQLSWDIKGDVAPINAEVYMKKGRFYLKAIEKGVSMKNGKYQLEEDEVVRLYNGTEFQIGTTTFTYQETDMGEVRESKLAKAAAAKDGWKGLSGLK